MNDAPYKLSRSAMRRQYGSRAIDASAPTVNPINNVVTKATEWAAKFPKSKWAASVLNPVDTATTASSPLTGFWAQKATQYATPIGPTQPAEPVAGVEQYRAPIGPVASISDMAKPPGYAARWQQAATARVSQRTRAVPTGTFTNDSGVYTRNRVLNNLTAGKPQWAGTDNDRITPKLAWGGYR